jgi:hypothetical protein
MVTALSWRPVFSLGIAGQVLSFRTRVELRAASMPDVTSAVLGISKLIPVDSGGILVTTGSDGQADWRNFEGVEGLRKEVNKKTPLIDCNWLLPSTVGEKRL